MSRYHCHRRKGGRKPFLPIAVSALVAAAFGAGCAVGVQPIVTASPAEVPALETALAERPDNPDLLLRLGVAYREAGRTGDALGVLERARGLPSVPAGVHYYLGLMYEEEDRWGDARTAYLDFLEVSTRDDLSDQVRRRLPVLRRNELVAEARESLAREVELAGAAPAEGTVAVFPFRFEGADPELAPLGRALAQLTVTDLMITGRLRVLERMQVQLLLDELRLAEEGYVDPATAARSGRLLGADRIVQGSVDAVQEQVDILATVVPTQTGAAGPPVSESDALQEIFRLQKWFVLALHEALGIQLTDAERELILQQPTRTLEALLLYGRALEAEDTGDWEQAATLYEEIVASDPGFDEAREGRERTGGAVVAVGTDLGQLADAGQSMVPPGIGTPGALDPRAGFTDVEALIPTPGQRDPAAELSGREGIGTGSTVIEIILRLPGGGP